MSGMVLTVVSAEVDADRVNDLIDAYRSVLSGPLPAGLLGSALLRGASGRWEISTMWRDRAALDAMRAATGTPAAVAVFQAAGATPAISILDVVMSLMAPQ
jgi:hypothetical protein